MIAGIALVKDESDIIVETVTHMATQVDRLFIADNASSDGTRDILESFTNIYDLTLIDDPEPGYYQSAKMSHLASVAASHGAQWVVPFDADEIWRADEGTVADFLRDQPAHINIVTATLYDHVATGIDDSNSDPVSRITWRRRKPLELPKVACRAQCPVVIQQGNHNAVYPTHAADGLTVRHFPYRSAEQFLSKVRNGSRAYAATDLPESHGSHWRGYGRILEALGEEALGDVFRRWFWVADPTNDLTLMYDPALP